MPPLLLSAAGPCGPWEAWLGAGPRGRSRQALGGEEGKPPAGWPWTGSRTQRAGLEQLIEPRVLPGEVAPSRCHPRSLQRAIGQWTLGVGCWAGHRAEQG